MFSACLPTHLKGVVVQVFYPLFCGIPVVILPKFDPDQFCRFIERYKVTVGYIVPPILLALVHHPGKAQLPSAYRLILITPTATNKYDLRSLKFLTSGAAPLSAGVVTQAVKKLRSVGATVAINQGLAHARSFVVTNLTHWPRLWPD
jgi:4-coumarate--CoA ligase